MSTPPEHAKPASGQRPADQGTPASPDGPGVVKRTTNTAKRILLVVIGALVALFAVFNSQEVEVRWIFGSPIQTPLILALAVTLVAGVAIGYLWAKLGGRGTTSS